MLICYNVGQFDSAGLSLYNNNWSNIHDYTPAADVETWSLLPQVNVLPPPTPPPSQKSPIRIPAEPLLGIVLTSIRNLELRIGTIKIGQFELVRYYNSNWIFFVWDCVSSCTEQQVLITYKTRTHAHLSVTSLPQAVN